MSGAKKFAIPLTDDFMKDDTSAPVKKYFQAGSICNQAKPATVDPASTCSDNLRSEVSEGSSTSAVGVVPEKEDLMVADELNTRHKGQSAFESAFSTLKDSKYYEIPETKTDLPTKPCEKSSIPAKTVSIIVNSKQKGNPLLKHIRNVPWEFGEIEPDYLVGQTTCVLFLSVRYHNLFPNYIHERLKSLGKVYQLRVLLLQLDMSDPFPAVRELSRIAILTDFTLMCAWSAEEAGNYLETYKMFENKSPDLIMERQDNDSYSKVVDALSSVKSVNQTDALTLLTTFGSLENVIKAKREQLILCPGMGLNKANKLLDVFLQPFMKSSDKKNVPQ